MSNEGDFFCAYMFCKNEWLCVLADLICRGRLVKEKHDLYKKVQNPEA